MSSISTIQKENFEQWAIVELFGHQKIAGRVTEQTIGGCAFVRVDVPTIENASGGLPIRGFTKLFGQGAIYGMSFVDEEAARSVAKQLRVVPLDEWSLADAVRAMNPERVQRLLGSSGAQSASFADENDDGIPL